VGLELGRKVADVVIQKVKTDGAGDESMLASKENTGAKNK
jgi:hypothetical protein